MDGWGGVTVLSHTIWATVLPRSYLANSPPVDCKVFRHTIVKYLDTQLWNCESWQIVHMISPWSCYLLIAYAHFPGSPKHKKPNCKRFVSAFEVITIQYPNCTVHTSYRVYMAHFPGSPKNIKTKIVKCCLWSRNCCKPLGLQGISTDKLSCIEHIVTVTKLLYFVWEFLVPLKWFFVNM